MTRNARKRILAAHLNTPCAYCGVRMTRRDHDNTDTFAQTDATIEHITPTSRGGSDHCFTVACYGCNDDKGDLTLNEWRAVLSVRYTTVCVFWFERRIPSLLLGIALWNIAQYTPYI